MRKTDQPYREEFTFSKLAVQQDADLIDIRCYFDSIWYGGFSTVSGQRDIVVYSLIQEGCAVQTLPDGRKKLLPAGCFSISERPAEISTTYVEKGQYWKRKCLIVQRSVFHDLLLSHFFSDDRILIPLCNMKKVEQILDSIHEALKKEIQDAAELSGLFLHLLCELKSQVPQILEPEPSRIAREFMQIHFRSPELTKKDVAQAAGISPRTLERLFFKEGKPSPAKMLSTLRLEYAKELLCSSSFSIKEIAVQSGFPDADLFSKKFKTVFHCTPTTYRNKRRLLSPLENNSFLKDSWNKT